MIPCRIHFSEWRAEVDENFRGFEERTKIVRIDTRSNDDLILILQLRGISITQFFKKYFPSNDDIDYSQISQELNQAFYDNDVKKLKS